MSVYIGRSLGHASTSEAEHWLISLGQPVLSAFTHLVRSPRPHVALSFEVPDTAGLPEQGDELSEAAQWACEQHRSRMSGRAFRYQGMELLTGEMTVAQLVSHSAIERVVVIGGGSAVPETVVETNDFVRPQWMDGELTLVTAPAGPGRIAPFEQANPMDCCQDH